MTRADRWLLPEGVEEVLPPQALMLETLRRDILDLYQSWGYELVITPLIEFLDSLLVGSSHDLDIHTFKITDQLSGRMMGLSCTGPCWCMPPMGPPLKPALEPGASNLLKGGGPPMPLSYMPALVMLVGGMPGGGAGTYGMGTAAGAE
jgi:hypothetical protein